MGAKQVFTNTLVVLLTLAGAYLVIRLLDIIVLFVIAIIFASAISPAVAFLNRKLPLGISIAIVYLGIILVFAGILSLIIPTAVRQGMALVESGPDMVQAVERQIIELQQRFNIPVENLSGDLQEYYRRLISSAPRLAAGILNVTLSFISGLGAFVAILVMAFYWLLERRGVQSTWIGLASPSSRPEIRHIIDEIEAKIGAYARGQITLGLIVGVASFIGLTILGIKYAAILALIAGISELIPIVGPIVGAIPAVLIALSQSPKQAILVVLLYVIIQQMENHLLVPKIMQMSVGLSPLTVLFVVLAGGSLMGIIGVLLAVPIASAIQVILSYTLLRRDEAGTLYREGEKLEAPSG